MAAKRPTGELPKRNSKLAQFISGTKSNKLNPAQARAAAGKYRDTAKAAGGFKGVGAMDQSGAALGKAIKEVKKAAAKKAAVKPAAASTTKPKPTASGTRNITGSASTSGGRGNTTSVTNGASMVKSIKKKKA
jgi:hypothetical protein